MSRLVTNLMTIKHTLMNAVDALEWHRKRLVSHGECIDGHPDDALMANMIYDAYGAINDILYTTSPTPEDAFKFGSGIHPSGMYYTRGFILDERLAFESWLSGVGGDIGSAVWDDDLMDYVDPEEYTGGFVSSVEIVQMLWAAWRDRAFLAGQ